LFPFFFKGFVQDLTFAAEHLETLFELLRLADEFDSTLLKIFILKTIRQIQRSTAKKQQTSSLNLLYMKRFIDHFYMQIGQLTNLPILDCCFSRSDEFISMSHFISGSFVTTPDYHDVTSFVTHLYRTITFRFLLDFFESGPSKEIFSDLMLPFFSQNYAASLDLITVFFVVYECNVKQLQEKHSKPLDKQGVFRFVHQQPPFKRLLRYLFKIIAASNDRHHFSSLLSKAFSLCLKNDGAGVTEEDYEQLYQLAIDRNTNFPQEMKTAILEFLVQLQVNFNNKKKQSNYSSSSSSSKKKKSELDNNTTTTNHAETESSELKNLRNIRRTPQPAKPEAPPTQPKTLTKKRKNSYGGYSDEEHPFSDPLPLGDILEDESSEIVADPEICNDCDSELKYCRCEKTVTTTTVAAPQKKKAKKETRFTRPKSVCPSCMMIFNDDLICCPACGRD
jgi:hypothetical protein